ERHEHGDDAGHEGEREGRPLPAALRLAGAEHAHRDGDHRIHARGQADEQAAHERGERGIDGPARERLRERVGRGRPRCPRSEQESGGQGHEEDGRRPPGRTHAPRKHALNESSLVWTRPWPPETYYGSAGTPVSEPEPPHPARLLARPRKRRKSRRARWISNARATSRATRPSVVRRTKAER